MHPPNYACRYFLRLEPGGEELEVTKAEFVAAERAAGFRNTSGRDDEPATGGFGNGTIRGRVEYHFNNEETTT